MNGVDGWHMESTSGGCYALIKESDSGAFYVMITNDEQSNTFSADDVFDVGAYRNDDCWGSTPYDEIASATSLASAIEMGDRMLRRMDMRDEGRRETTIVDALERDVRASRYGWAMSQVRMHAERFGRDTEIMATSGEPFPLDSIRLQARCAFRCAALILEQFPENQEENR